MAECLACGESLHESDVAGCTDERTITFADGETVEPMAYGEEEMYRDYDEMVASFEEEIENGGRGNLTAEDVKEDLAAFKRHNDKEEFNNRTCHDCGAAQGEYHHPGCDTEECPRCGGQYFMCDCSTEEKRKMWGE